MLFKKSNSVAQNNETADSGSSTTPSSGCGAEVRDLQDVKNSSIMDSLNRSQAVIEFEPSGKILNANENFLATVGYSLSEIKGQHHSLFVDPSYAKSASYSEFWEKLRQGEFQSAEFQRFGKGGREIWIQATYNPVLDEQGNVSMVVKFASDITRQKQALKEIQDRSQALIEFEPDGTILNANELFLQTVGYSMSEIKGQHHRMFMPPGEASTQEYAEFWPLLARGEFRQGEFRRVKKSGEELWLQGAYNPVFDNTGAVVRVVKGVADITATIKGKGQADRIGKTIAKSVGEMTSSIGEISQSISRTAALAQKAETNADDAKKIVDELNQSSTTIGRVVNVIQDLSEQTNLLALNATIEAARAGETGRGFAVVANEVKMLANQTGEATSDIRTSIETIQGNISGVVEAIQGIAEGVTEVSTNTSTVAAAVEEQSALMGGMNDTAEELLQLNTNS